VSSRGLFSEASSAESTQSAGDASAPRPPYAIRPWLRIVLGLVVATVLGLFGYRYWQSSRAFALRDACLAARRASDWGEAERLAVTWASYEPMSADPLILAAEAAMQRNNFGAAGDYLDLLPDDDPKTIPALLQRVDLMFGQLSRPFEALRTLERLLKIDPACCEALQRLTFYEAITLQRMETAKVARRAIAAKCDLPETFVYLLGADWLTLANTESVNLRWLAENPGTELFAVAALRGEIANRGLEDSIQDEEAAQEGSTSDLSKDREDRIQALFELFPENLELLAYFLQKAQTAGEVETAARLLTSAPPKAQDDNRFWRFKAWLHGTRNELDEADAAYDKARELFPFDAAAMHEQAVILRKLGKEQEAAELAALADRGRTLRRTILQQPSVQATSPETLVEIADFFADCGDTATAERLRERMREMARGASPPATAAPTAP
jgi:uncharacterized protein HemY